MTPTVLKTTAQILILAVGIYWLLAFLRSTRGSGLVRGLGVTLIVGVYGLWGIADRLGLEELRHVIQGFLGLVFVILAIIFQPELRRGLASLSDNPLLSRLFRTQRKESRSEVAAAIQTMAKKKQGALIAFERRTPLEPYIESAVRLDCEANRYLIDSLFHHGNALHDGAVVVRGERVIAAAVILPLSESDEIAKSTGTRHRAALGISEQTDAVAVVVSEETGTISIAKHGTLVQRVPRDGIEDALRDALGPDELQAHGARGEAEDRTEPEPRISFLRLAVAHGGQKLGALVLAALVFYGAHQDLMGHDSQSFVIEQGTPSTAPQPGKLAVYLPSPDYKLDEGSLRPVEVTFVGTHEALADLPGLSGSVTLTDAELGDGQGGTITLDIGRVEWGLALRDRMDVFWSSDPPQLLVEGVATAEIALEPDLVKIDTSGLTGGYGLRRDLLEFRPASLTVRGKRSEVERLLMHLERHTNHGPDVEQPDPIFELVDPVVATTDDRTWLRARLTGEWSALALDQQLNVGVVIELQEVAIGVIEVPIALVSLRGEAKPSDFDPPSTQASLRILGRGIPPLVQGTEEWTVAAIQVRELLKERVRAFLDVDRVETGSNLGHVQVHGAEEWRELLPELGELFETAAGDPRRSLRVELMSEREVYLTRRPPAEAQERENPTPSGGRE